MRSGKEVGGALSNKKIVTIEDDDKGMVNSKIGDSVKDKRMLSMVWRRSPLKKYQTRKVSLRLTLEPYLSHKGL